MRAKRHMRRKRFSYGRFPIEIVYRIRVDYVLNAVDFRAFDRLLFAEAAKVIGGKGYSSGSGAWESGDRDHDWEIADKKLARKLARGFAAFFKKGPPEAKGRVTVYGPPAVVFDADPSLVKSTRRKVRV